MSKFGFLKRTHIDSGPEGWRWMRLPEVSPHAAILVANATQENVAMVEEALRRADVKEDDRGAFSPEKIAKGQEEDRSLLQRHVVKGWRGMYEVEEDGTWVLSETGAPVEIEFNSANLRDFLSQIQGWLLTRIKQWCMNPENFLDKGAAPPPLPNGNELGKE